MKIDIRMLPLLFVCIHSFGFSMDFSENDYYYKKSMKSYEEREYDIAEKNIHKTLQLYPDHILYNQLLFKIYLRLQRYQSAKQILLKKILVLDINQDIDLLDLMHDISYLYYLSGDYQTALNYLSQIIDKYSSDIISRYNSGICYLRLNQLNKAKYFFEYVLNHTKSNMIKKCVLKRLNKNLPYNNINQYSNHNTSIQYSLLNKNPIAIDNIPGIVKILHGKELKSRGKNHLWEALSDISGFAISFDEKGYLTTIIRGIAKNSSTNYLKIFVNGNPFQSTPYGPNPLLDIPIEQVDYIEIIRSPTSSLYGDYGYLSAINIITKKKNILLSLKTDSASSLGGTAIYSYPSLRALIDVTNMCSRIEYTNPGFIRFEDYIYQINLEKKRKALKENDFTFSINTSVFDTPNYQIFNNNSDANQNVHIQTCFLNLEYNDFIVDVNYIEKKQGDFIEKSTYSNPSDNRFIFQENLIGVTAKRQINLYETNKNEIYLDCNISIQKGDFNLHQPDLLYNEKDYSVYYAEKIISGGVDLFYKKRWLPQKFNHSNKKFLDKYLWQHFLVGWSFTNVSILNIEDMIEGSEKKLYKDMINKNKLETHSLTVQDQIKFCNSGIITAGFRYEFNDNQLCPKIATVYKDKKESFSNIYKAEYSQGYIPYKIQPVVFQLFPMVSSGVRPVNREKLDMYELCYIFEKLKDDDTHFKFLTSLFYSELDNHKSIEAFSSEEDIQFKGFELELENELTHQLAFNMNVSYVKTKSLKTQEEIFHSIDWLSNASLTYTKPRYSFYVGYRYLGNFHRSPNDPREDLNGYGIFNVAFNIYNLFYEGISFQINIHNVLNTTSHYPSVIYSEQFDNFDDLSRSDRQWLFNISWEY